jgi:hypothetical protein
MTPQECPHEEGVAAAIRQRGWRVDDELLRHAADCAVCAEVVAVCEALAGDFEAGHRVSGHTGHALPSAGQVWHRATLRARADAVDAASRSLVWAYGLAGAAVAGLTAAFVASMWPVVFPLLRRLAETGAARQTGLPIIVAIGACLAVASVAVYVAIRGDQKL